ncbi:hypothetical protein ES703_104558 [subsurface metagenome]
MNRVCLAAFLILGTLVRIHCGQPTPAAGGKAVEGTATPVAAAESVVEPALATTEPAPEALASSAATELQPTSAPAATKTATRLPSRSPTPAPSATPSSTSTSLPRG